MQKKMELININITINTDVYETKFESENGLFRIYFAKFAEREIIGSYDLYYDELCNYYKRGHRGPL